MDIPCDSGSYISISCSLLGFYIISVFDECN
jgi:hypothetical protein